MKEVLYTQKFADGYLAHCMNDKDVKEQVSLIEIRGAVIKPVEIYPGYFVFFGMMKEPNIFQKYPIMFLCEGEARTQGPLLEKMFNDASRMKASVIYADRERQGKMEGFYQDIWRERRQRNLPLRVMPAPSPDDIDYGVGILRDWSRDKAVERPRITKTILSDQISSMTDETEIDASFYAFHALRFLLAGFVKTPPLRTMRTTKGWGDRFDGIEVQTGNMQGRTNNRLGAWI